MCPGALLGALTVLGLMILFLRLCIVCKAIENVLQGIAEWTLDR
jgi:hypothetical protein